MSKTIGIDELVWAAEGPRKKVPTYPFRRRTFKEYEKPPGQHKPPTQEPTNHGN